VTQYAVIRTSKDNREWIWSELGEGRLRQGWGWLPEQDLDLIYEKRNRGEDLRPEEKSSWRSRRMLGKTWNGLKVGDVVVSPNLPEQGKWVLMRVAGEYRYDRPPGKSETDEPGDFGHILPVEPVKVGGKIAVIDPSSPFVDARLRGTMRTMSRIWGIDHLAEAVKRLTKAIASGEDTSVRQSPEQRRTGFLDAVREQVSDVVWSRLHETYRGAEFEHLLVLLLESVYGEGSVEHKGGPREKGADLIVTTKGPLGLVFKTAVQAKLYDGKQFDLHPVEQLRWARDNHGVQAGVVLTTAEEVSQEVQEALTKAAEDLQIDVRVWVRDDFVRLLLRYLGQQGPTGAIDR